MSELMMLGGGWVFIALCLNAVLWFFLPFAIFGMKGRIDTLQKIGNAQLRELRKLTRDIPEPVVPIRQPRKWWK